MYYFLNRFFICSAVVYHIVFFQLKISVSIFYVNETTTKTFLRKSFPSVIYFVICVLLIFGSHPSFYLTQLGCVFIVPSECVSGLSFILFFMAFVLLVIKANILPF